MGKKSKKQKIAYLKRIAKSYGVPRDLIDWQSEVSSDLTYEEEKTRILPKIKQLASSKDNGKKIEEDYGRDSNISHEKEQGEKHNEEELEREEKHIKEELDKSINEIKTTSTNKLNEYFYTPKKLIETLVNSDDTSGLILKGEAGIGKSYTTIQKLREMGLKKGEDFEVVNSYITPLSLYRFLYRHRKKIIILDDTVGFFSVDRNIGIVLSALWGDSGKRAIQYNSSKLNDIPNTFEFSGKMIVCLNEVPNQIQHIKSRCFFYEIEFTNEEKMELITEVAKINDIPMKIINFIGDNLDSDVINLDFRLLFKVYDVYKNNDEEWREIASNLINKDKRVGLLIRYLRKYNTVREARLEWEKETGHSKSTFFRIKKRHNVE